MIGIPANDTDEAMRDFVDRHGLEGMLQVVDDDGSLWARFGVAYQPAWVFVTPGGEVETVAGAIPDDELAERLEALATS